MKLGFVSAIVPERSLEEVFDLAKETGYDSVEVMCWPPGKADRRYAGVTHINVGMFSQDKANTIKDLAEEKGVQISGLGYYPNLLAPYLEERRITKEHLKLVIRASSLLGLDTVSTFIGRDWQKTVEDNWPSFLAIWPDIVRYAEDNGVRIAIENCPMYFTRDEWPGGKNLASSPELWDRIFEAIPSSALGLEFDPSHMVWQGQDYIAPLKLYKDKIFRVHVKDAILDHAAANRLGIFAYPLQFHTPVLPGRGDIDWAAFFAALQETGYDSFVTVEVEDVRYETSEQHRLALVESAQFVRPFIA